MQDASPAVQSIAKPARLKAISPARDRLQSRVLIAVMLPVLVLLATLSMASFLDRRLGAESASILEVLFGVSLTFAVAVWALRAATPLAAFAGGLINFIVLGTTCSFASPRAVQPYAVRILASGMTPLLLLFVLTFAATKAGKRRKQLAGLAESRTGRHAAQVIANLGAAALATIPVLAQHAGTARHDPSYPFGVSAAAVCLLAVLAEATADTVSSEIGQAFGGMPVLITSLRRVSAGTDGAVSLNGTLAGLSAAALVAGGGALALGMPRSFAVLAWLAGAAGLIFDSVLGATVERSGRLGNDLVNFSSTLFAGVLALLAVSLMR